MDTNNTPNSEQAGGTSMGMQENVAGLLCYVLGWVTGVIFLIAEKNSRFVKFHAWQSILLSIVFGVVYWVLQMILLGVLPISMWWLVTMILPLLFLVIWVWTMVQAYQHKEFKLPLIGDLAHNLAYKQS